jgi:autotransporter adhesin
MPGITSAASAAAQTGPRQIVTSDSGGNLATATPAGLGLVSSADLADVNARLGGLQQEARRGIAAVAAMPAAMTPSAPGKTTVVVGTGFYRTEMGMGIAVAHRFQAAYPIVLQGSYSNGGGTEHAGRVGLGVEF